MCNNPIPYIAGMYSVYKRAKCDIFIMQSYLHDKEYLQIYYKYNTNTMKFQNMTNTINNHVITVTLGPPYVLFSLDISSFLTQKFQPRQVFFFLICGHVPA
jgi:hypothetical protein